MKVARLSVSCALLAVISNTRHAVGIIVIGPQPISYYSFGNGISADGSTVVGIMDEPSGGTAFRWSQSTDHVSLGNLPGPTTPDSHANAASSDGAVIVG